MLVSYLMPFRRSAQLRGNVYFIVVRVLSPSMKDLVFKAC